MGRHGPTLVPDEQDIELPTEDLSQRFDQQHRWSRLSPVNRHPFVDAFHATRGSVAGVLILPHRTAPQRGSTWIRRATWWLQVHAPIGIPEVIDTGVDAHGSPWMVVSPPPGESFRVWRATAGAVPLEEVITATAQAAALLSTIHASGWAHQDVRPETLYRSTSGSVTLGSWGMVGSSRGQAAEASDDSSHETGAQADIRGLAIAALQTLAPESRALVRAGRVGDAVALAFPDPTIQMRVMRHIFSRAVHPDPHERWQQMGVFHDELSAWLDSFGRGRWG